MVEDSGRRGRKKKSDTDRESESGTFCVLDCSERMGDSAATIRYPAMSIRMREVLVCHLEDL